MRRRSNLCYALRRRRALRVAVGERRFRWRPLDRLGRIPFDIPSLVKSEADAVRACHDWLTAYVRKTGSAADFWWFSVEELAFDTTGRYSVVVRHWDQLVYLETLWTGPRDPFVTQDRKAVPYG